MKVEATGFEPAFSRPQDTRPLQVGPFPGRVIREALECSTPAFQTGEMRCRPTAQTKKAANQRTIKSSTVAKTASITVRQYT